MHWSRLQIPIATTEREIKIRASFSIFYLSSQYLGILKDSIQSDLLYSTAAGYEIDER